MSKWNVKMSRLPHRGHKLFRWPLNSCHQIQHLQLLILSSFLFSWQRCPVSYLRLTLYLCSGSHLTWISEALFSQLFPSILYLTLTLAFSHYHFNISKFLLPWENKTFSRFFTSLHILLQKSLLTSQRVAYFLIFEFILKPPTALPHWPQTFRKGCSQGYQQVSTSIEHLLNMISL